MFRFIIPLFIYFPLGVAGQYLLPAACLSPTGNTVYSHFSQEPFSGQANPAAVSRIKSSLGLLTEHQFMLRELSFVGFSAVYSNRHSGAGLFFHSVGDFLNFQNTGGLLLARDLGKVAVGIEISRHQWKTSGYARLVHYTGSAGCLFELSPKCITGFVASPVLVPFSSGQAVNPIARKFRWGIGYECSDEVFFSFCAGKD